VIAPARTRARTAKHKETAPVKSLGRIANTVKLTATCMLLAGIGLLFAGAPGASAAGPELTVQVTPGPATFHRGELAAKGLADYYQVTISNVGDSPTTGPVAFTDTLPEGLGLIVPFAINDTFASYPCAGDGQPGQYRGATVLTCELPTINPGEPLSFKVTVSVFDAPDPAVNHITVSGGGAPEVSVETVTPVADQIPYAVKEFTSRSTDGSEVDYTVAGGHPYQNHTRFSMPISDEEGFVVAELKDASVDLVNGFFGNPAAAPRCEVSKVPSFEVFPGQFCPIGSKVGYAEISDTGFHPNLYNVKPERGHPAEFAFNFLGVIVTLPVTPRARTESYGLTLGTENAGRIGIKAFTTHFNGIVSNGTEAPFLSNPVDCSETNPVWKVFLDSWEDPARLLPTGRPDLSDANWKTKTFPAPPVTGCGDPALADQFKPSLDVKPDQGGAPVQADQPTGLSVKLDFPQSNDPTDLNTTFDASIPQAPELKDITMKLPAGLAISPSSATGLQACSDLASDPAGDQVHYDNTKPVECAEASKIGTVTATTPLLASHDPVTDAVTGAEPIPGDVYLLKPHQGDLSPNGDQDGTFRLLLQLDSPRYGINFKLPGTAVADKNTGQLTATFTENPQLPAKHLEVNLKSGPRAPLMTPSTCGDFTTTSTLVPWSAPETPNATPSSKFNVGSGPGGSPCASSPGARPFSPSLSAGSGNADAGSSAPFVLKIARNDGEQELGSVDVTLPKGLTAKLAGVPYCSDAAIVSATGKSGAAEQANPSCSSASQVGSVIVGAGPGSEPFYAEGKAYLSGPYKGAPLSLAFITPAVAGPFDLGDVVVRAALFVDPETAQVTVKTDPIPKMLDGVPLDIRSLVTKIDRSDFTLNPTSCAAKSVESTLGGASGATAHPSNTFQVAGCNRLGFTPKLALKLKGSTKRGKFPALTATLTQPAGQANIGHAVVSLPHSEFLEQGHIGTICTRVQFAADQCPAASIYGMAKATTPLLDKPLEGPVYLRSSNHPLPDLVAALDGQIDVDLVGRIDSFKGGLRTTFDTVPDAPVSSFTLAMKGGKKGLLVNSRDLCKTKNRVTVELEAQNGRKANSKPLLKNGCKKAKKKSGKRHHKHPHSR
jgi:hypothetical protein